MVAVPVSCLIAAQKVEHVAAGRCFSVEVDPTGFEATLGVVDRPSPRPGSEHVLLRWVTSVDRVRVRVDAVTIEGGDQLISVHAQMIPHAARSRAARVTTFYP